MLKLSGVLASSLILASAASLFAADRERAVTAAPTVTIRGVVRDASGAPVPAAYLRSGNYISSRNNGTKADGKYSLTIPAGRPTLVTVDDFAFESVTTTITPTADMAIDFTLTLTRPTVTVTLNSGESHVLDLGSSRFAYYVVFANYARFNEANLCMPDGSASAPNKSEIAKITGPFARVNFSPCCARGPIVTANIELKSGEKSQVYFTDSCYDEELDFLGRERSTGTWWYLKFDDLAEITFQ